MHRKPQKRGREPICIENHISKMTCYYLNLHNSKFIQSNKMLNSKHILKNAYIHVIIRSSLKKK